MAARRHGNGESRPAPAIPAPGRQPLSELLAERAGHALSRARIRRIVLAAGLHRPRPPAPPPQRQRRARDGQAGRLVQLDASPPNGLHGRGPRLTRSAAIDEATSAVPAALFRVTAEAYGSCR